MVAVLTTMMMMMMMIEQCASNLVLPLLLPLPFA
jgi:hypothetical protein